MDITRKKFLQLAGAAGLLLVAGKIFAADEKILVAYFSRVGEEYGLGVLSKGNTAIVAEIIAQKTGGDIFEIKPVTPYPVAYEDCKKIAKHEQETKARPPLADDVDISGYDTIFVGYPIWFKDAPQIIYSFLEKHDFSGKKIVPFCTHSGDGIFISSQNISLTCPKANVLSGISIQRTIAHKDRARTETIVTDSLRRYNLI